ncbi:MAG: cnpD [Chlamydiales bacterium]|jgi:ribonuclease Y|nr:cnpD [Chlamydiales bacterium]
MANEEILTIPIIFSTLLGISIGCTVFWLFHRIKVGSYRALASQIIRKGEIDVLAYKESAELAIKKKQLEYQHELDKRFHQERLKIQKEEERLKKREDKIEGRVQLIERKLEEIEKKDVQLNKQQEICQDKLKAVESLQSKLQDELQKVSGLSLSEAKELYLERIASNVKADASNLIRKIKTEAEEYADREATKIIASAVNRLAVSCTSELTVSTISLPNDEIKGRIIGREGRNIRALEHATGVNFIIDETPCALTLSCFDPIRKQIAKEALADLVQDGRIHPGSIEDAVLKAKKTVGKQIKEAGEEAVSRVGIVGLHPELIILLGKLKFRYSYGQNILEHSIEVSEIMGMMAAELGLDIMLAKRIGLLHDMGKAVTHEIEGSHAIIGHDLAKKFGENQAVANGIGCHHYEMPPLTIEGSLCSAADAMSAARPGARAESVEFYIKRLQQLEEIAKSYVGVEEAYVMQAGRELRVHVSPENIDDNGVLQLAYDISKRIQQEMHYPGKIKVIVIREKRAIEYAV